MMSILTFDNETKLTRCTDGEGDWKWPNGGSCRRAGKSCCCRACWSYRAVGTEVKSEKVGTRPSVQASLASLGGLFLDHMLSFYSLAASYCIARALTTARSKFSCHKYTAVDYYIEGTAKYLNRLSYEMQVASTRTQQRPIPISSIQQKTNWHVFLSQVSANA